MLAMPSDGCDANLHNWFAHLLASNDCVHFPSFLANALDQS